MDVTVQLVVEIVVTLVFQVGATSGALETFNVQVLVLDANENATSMLRRNSIFFGVSKKKICQLILVPLKFQ